MNDSCKLSFAYPFGNSNSRQLRKFMAKNYIAARGSFSSTHWITESYSPQHMEHLVSSLLVTGNVQFMTPAVQAAVNQGCGWLIFNGHGLDRCGSDDGCGCQTGWEPLNYDMFETHLHTIATLVQLSCSISCSRCSEALSCWALGACRKFYVVLHGLDICGINAQGERWRSGLRPAFACRERHVGARGEQLVGLSLDLLRPVVAVGP
eukprot:TRINITY_DN6763_c0_g1_i3.p1 TRINITY_DN6763_c0_g1~~TRINITY_DN6763_c0_g1_i3.p1  ORF type:complete len:207 (+),score=22.92 TRINITY_DN6763_c0_g1_i3:91-711(+)